MNHLLAYLDQSLQYLMEQNTGPFTVIVYYQFAFVVAVVAFITALPHWEVESLSPGYASCDTAVHAGCHVSKLRL